MDYVCADINHMAWYLKFEHKGLQPMHVGALPASCAMLASLSAQIEMMVVTASTCRGSNAPNHCEVVGRGCRGRLRL